jgi:hypothetical protein
MCGLWHAARGHQAGAASAIIPLPQMAQAILNALLKQPQTASR